MRGDLSAPVLAIIVTIGIIAAGLLLMAWFWWFAPTAAKTGALQIIGTPAVVCRTTTSYAVVSMRNLGGETVSVTDIYVGELLFNVDPDVTLDPGESEQIIGQYTGACPTEWKYSVDGVVVTTAGTYASSFIVIKTG